MILILPRPPLWAEPNEPNYLYISQVSKTKLYLNLLSYSDSHEFSYYLDPPWTKTKKPNINYTSRVRRKRPIFTFSFLTHLFVYLATITDYLDEIYWLLVKITYISIANWAIFPDFLFHLDETFRLQMKMNQLLFGIIFAIFFFHSATL